MKFIPVFVLLFLLSVSVQALIWHVHDFADEQVWTTRTERLAKDIRQWPLRTEVEAYSGHPGMTVLVPAAILWQTGLTANESLLWGLTTVNGLIITGVFLVARKLHLNSVWWFAAGLIVLVHPLHLQATPTNTVMSTLTVFIFLLVWYMYQRPVAQHIWHPFALLGVSLGAGLATRFAFALILSLAIGIYLLPRVRRQHLFFLGATSVVTFVLLDPLIWSAPVQHLAYMFGRANIHFSALEATSFQAADFLLFAPFGLLSIALYLLLTLPAFQALRPLPRPIGLFLLIFTITVAGVYLGASGKSLRYFYPLIFVWEALLPLFLISLASRITLPSTLRIKRKFERLIPNGLALSVAAAELFLLLFSLHLSMQRELIDWQQLFPPTKPHSLQTNQEMVS